jgi:hypothetical protein
VRTGVLAVLTSLIEPLSQSASSVLAPLPRGLVLTEWFAVDFAQAVVFRKYGLLAAILVRVAFYADYHVIGAPMKGRRFPGHHHRLTFTVARWYLRSIRGVFTRGSSGHPGQIRAHILPTSDTDREGMIAIASALPDGRDRRISGDPAQTDRDGLNLFGFKSHRHRHKKIPDQRYF